MYTAISHPNIALIKYWGKKDKEKNIPINGSLSITLDIGKTKTIAQFNSDGIENQFILNNNPVQITARHQKAIDFFQPYINKTCQPTNFLINSENDFPTAAGFASSASGAAAFVCSIASLVGDTKEPIEYWNERNINLSRITRMVSGSGCRSIYGGFVEWSFGDDLSSISKQLFDENYWPELIGLSICLSSSKKLVSSTEGMQRSVETVPWLQYRSENIVPQRIESLKNAIQNHDFQNLGEITMKESNELHANCAASYPPFHYLTEESYKIIDTIHSLNLKHQNQIIAAYTFDAGPNPFIFCQESNLTEVKNALIQIGISENSIKSTKPSNGIQIF